MNFEDELREGIWSFNSKYIEEELARKIAILINKARSKPTRRKARLYIDRADSVLYKAGEKVVNSFLCQSELIKSAANLKGELILPSKIIKCFSKT